MIESEQTPAWLMEQSNTFLSVDCIKHFFFSRTVFYPGSGFDGQPIQFFNSERLAHCYIYVDYGLDQQKILKTISDRGSGFRGYKSFARIPLTQNDLTPRGWTPHITPNQVRGKSFVSGFTTPFAFLEIMERESSYDDSHGAKRFAVLFLGADGIASYDAIFCQGANLAPWAIVLQDHGFGGNWDTFGGDSTLECLAVNQNVFPEYLLCAENTKPWANFTEIRAIEPMPGGEHGHLRRLHKRKV